MKKIIVLFCVSFFCMAAVHAASVKDSTFQQYVGKYTFPDGSVIASVTVSLDDNGGLTMSSSAGVSALEKQKDDDVFSIPSFQGIAKFKRDSSKKIIGVSIDAMGYQLEGTKVE